MLGIVELSPYNSMMNPSADDISLAIVTELETLSGVGTVHQDDTLGSHVPTLKAMLALIAAVEARVGVQLSISSLAEPLSIRAVAQTISKGNVESSIAILLRAGVGNAIFLVPGIGAAVSELISLSQAIDSDSPVYGLAYPGLNGTAPREYMSDLSGDMVVAINALQDSGIVHLVGYSAGGVVALDIARQLGRARIGLLAMIDSPLHINHWPLQAFLRFLLVYPFRSRTTSSSFTPTSHSLKRPTTSVSRLLLKFKRPLRKVAQVTIQRYGNPNSGYYLRNFPFYVTGLPSNVQNARDSAILAMARSCPSRYDGGVVYFVTDERDGLMCEPKFVWDSIAPNIQYVKIPGTHTSCFLAPHVAFLGHEIALRSKSQI